LVGFAGAAEGTGGRVSATARRAAYRQKLIVNNALSFVDYSIKEVFPRVKTMKPNMGALARHNRKWTAEGFAAWAARQDVPYEYDGNDPQMMTGACWPHIKVVRNIADALKPLLAGSAYDIFGPQDLIHTVGEVSRAPDVFVAPRLAGRPRIRFIPDPVAVIEVVSDDRDLDYVTKLIEYEQVVTALRHRRAGRSRIRGVVAGAWRPAFHPVDREEFGVHGT
jgi:hypothetical protein